MSEPRETIHFPIDTVDRAFVANRRNLLARDVYEAIITLVRASLVKVEHILANQSSDAICEAFDRLRGHEAVLLNGGRGTGKSSVLVNLSRYIAGHEDLHDNLLILKPVDPTLVENGDNLFLNVIVASLLRDGLVRKALRDQQEGTTEFYTELENLGSALEGTEKIGSEYGLDRLQAFIENQELAEHVHMLFYRTLRLTGKKLIVLPIDDVDTSLELAYDNIEVVRKYLTSPFVIPVISGDLDLYDDVIYRRFAHRLTKNGEQNNASALQRARSLAEEYERKVLPLPRRIRLPELSTYLDDYNIYLTENNHELIPLPLFKYWLETLLNDRVNGEDNSKREVPLSTVREFAQFVQACRHLLDPLKSFFDENEVNDDGAHLPLMMRRRMMMSTHVAQAVCVFEEQFDAAFAIRNDGTRTQRTARDQAYRALRENVGNVRTDPDDRVSKLRREWCMALADYAYYQRNWGDTYLVADANVHLMNARSNILEHDLFRPQRHGAKRYAHFDTGFEFAATWRTLLSSKAPKQWLARLPDMTLLSYPGPETGRHAGALVKGGTDLPLALAHRLLVHWSYYSPSARGDLLLCGRVFELLVVSLTCDLKQSDFLRILNQPPFYSLAEFARTKTLDVDNESSGDDGGIQDGAMPSGAEIDDGDIDTDFSELVFMVNEWRQRVQIVQPNAWFVFIVMNKFFSQVPYINRNTGLYDPSGETLNLAMQAFNLFWSAVGSFEKGKVFGLPQVVATVNMSGTAANFEQHPLYRQNISPFLQLRNSDGYHDFGTGSYTYALESHPLRRLWQRALSQIHQVAPRKPASTTPSHGATTSGFVSELDRRIDRYVNETAHKMALNLKSDIIDSTPDEILSVLVKSVEERCGRDPVTLEHLRAVLQATDLPKNSGRRRLQRVIEKLKR